MNFEDIGLHVPTILLPQGGPSYQKWAVVACDQYTWQPQYWNQVAAYTRGAPSTLNLVFPEVYLEAEGRSQHIQEIHQSMARYLEEGILVPK